MLTLTLSLTYSYLFAPDVVSTILKTPFFKSQIWHQNGLTQSVFAVAVSFIFK